MSEFTEKQQQYIAWLAQTKYERKPVTEQLFAVEIGISDRTLRRWKNSPEFRQAVTTQARQFLSDNLPEIYGALRREAEKGSFQHIKLSLELAGEYTNTVKVDDWRSELLDALKSGKIKPEEIPTLLGDNELAQEFFRTTGLTVGVGIDG